MDVRNESLNKLEKFFEYDLKLKEIMNNIMQIELDFYDDGTRFKYMDKLLGGIEKKYIY